MMFALLALGICITYFFSSVYQFQNTFSAASRNMFTLRYLHTRISPITPTYSHTLLQILHSFIISHLLKLVCYKLMYTYICLYFCLNKKHLTQFKTGIEKCYYYISKSEQIERKSECSVSSKYDLDKENFRLGHLKDNLWPCYQK